MTARNMLMSIKEQTLMTPYLQFDRNQWAALRDSVPMTLSEDEIARLKGINEDLSLEEVAEIYLPLSRLLNFYISSNLRRQAVLEQFLGTNGQRIPYIISIAGSVAVGKSTTKEDYTVHTDFFKAFKRDFKQSTALWLVLLLAGFAALTGLRTATAQDTPSTGILAAASFLLLVLAGCCGSWGFALLARFTYPGVLPVLADSGRMTLANLLPTVGNLAFLAWFPLLAKAAPAWFVYLLPLWLLIGGAGSALGMASLMRPAFAQLEKAGRKEEEPEEEPDTKDSVQ